MVNQTLIATGMIGVCEALLYAYRAGLDLPRVLESVSGGAAGSWSLSNSAPDSISFDSVSGAACSTPPSQWALGGFRFGRGSKRSRSSRQP
jgi:3-hydroxyisobutyrate dehydrogenase-like beta-hydroxyacid dehydrogenase